MQSVFVDLTAANLHYYFAGILRRFFAMPKAELCLYLSRQ